MFLRECRLLCVAVLFGKIFSSFHVGTMDTSAFPPRAQLDGRLMEDPDPIAHFKRTGDVCLYHLFGKIKYYAQLTNRSKVVVKKELTLVEKLYPLCYSPDDDHHQTL